MTAAYEKLRTTVTWTNCPASTAMGVVSVRDVTSKTFVASTILALAGQLTSDAVSVTGLHVDSRVRTAVICPASEVLTDPFSTSRPPLAWPGGGTQTIRSLLSQSAFGGCGALAS